MDVETLNTTSRQDKQSLSGQPLTLKNISVGNGECPDEENTNDIKTPTGESRTNSMNQKRKLDKKAQDMISLL